jgi:hypothetical protein
MKAIRRPSAPNTTRTPISGLVASGLAQVAAGALTGFPYAVANYRPEVLPRLGVQAPRRIRQLHLDLIIMGGLVTAAGTALPRLPRAVAIPLAVGCWTNALAFAPPAFMPSIERARPYRAAVAASFVTTTAGWIAVATIATRRWSRHTRGER